MQAHPAVGMLVSSTTQWLLVVHTVFKLSRQTHSNRDSNTTVLQA